MNMRTAGQRLLQIVSGAKARKADAGISGRLIASFRETERLAQRQHRSWRMAVTTDMVAERGKKFFPVVHGTTYYARRRPAGCFFS
jgi:hypothetical protein